MPNWVATKVQFNNITDEQFNRIVETYCTDGCLDFDKIIPMPDNIFRGPLGMEDREKYPGDLNWYDWSVDHWGTKWNASEGLIDRTTHTLRFQTAWSYAAPALWELADQLCADGTLSGEAMIEAYALNEDIACGAEAHYYDPESFWDDEFEYGTDEFWDISKDLWGITREEYEDDVEEEAEFLEEHDKPVKELTQQIETELQLKFPSYACELRDMILDDVIEDVQTSSDWPNYSSGDISMAIQRVILQQMGYEG